MTGFRLETVTDNRKKGYQYDRTYNYVWLQLTMLSLPWKGTIMTTGTKPQAYVTPGEPNSVVSVKPRYENFIGGRWVPPVDGEYTSNLSPATGKTFTQIPRSSANLSRRASPHIEQGG